MTVLYKRTLNIFVLLVMNITCYSQIGIYNEKPSASSALDISSTDKGFLLPSLTSVQKLAINNPAESLVVFDSDQNCVSQNIGTEASPLWICLTDYANYFFYMPSINISTETVGLTTNVDLFQIYRDQYTSPGVTSAGAPPIIPHYPLSSNLYYYVTYHDPTRIRINSISADGVMNYTVLKKADYDTYMNIIFVAK